MVLTAPRPADEAAPRREARQERETVHRQRTLILLLTLVAVARGVFWAAALPTPSPIDEYQHFDYVRSIARGDGIPTVGTDTVDDEVLAIAKQSPTMPFRSQPYPGDTSLPEWDPARQQHEAIQGPVYYALMAPFYWMGRPWGALGSFYLVRFGSVLLAALAVPATWQLTRRLTPGRPWLWLLPPLVLVTVNSVSAGAAALGNDTVVLTGTAVATTMLLRALERRSPGAAVLSGGTAGLVLVGKSTGLALVPVLALLGVASLVQWMREDLPGALRWTGAYATAFVAPMVLWTGWNLHAYGAISGAEAADQITGAVQASYADSWDTFAGHWSEMRHGFWAGQINDVLPAYRYTWELLVVAVVVVAGAVALRRRDRTGWSVAWGAAAYPLTFVTLATFFLLAFDQTGYINGRYAWVALVPVVIATALGCGVLGGRRWAVPLCLLVCTGMLVREVDLTHRFLQGTYEPTIADPSLAAAIEQSWNDGYAAADAIRIEFPCETHVLDLGLEDPPETIEIRADGGPVGTGTLEWAVPSQFARYILDEPTRGTAVIPVPKGVAISSAEREPAGSLVGGSGDPMFRAFCPVDDPRAVRFEQTYPPGHPPLERWMLYAWPVVWVVAAVVGALVTAVVSLTAGRPRTADTVSRPR